MRAALIVAGKELRARLRDRSVLVICIVAPLVLTVIMSTALPNRPLPSVRIAVVDLDGGPVGRMLGEAMASEPVQRLAQVVRAPDEAAAQALLDGGDADAVLVLVPGMTEGMRTGQVPQVRVVRDGDKEVHASITEALATELVSQYYGMAQAVQSVRAFPNAPPVEVLVERALASLRVGAVDDLPIGERDVRAASYFGPAMAIVFLFFGIGFVARQLPAERQDGTLRRVAAAPVGAASVVLGKALAASVVGLFQMVAIWAACVVLLGATWGDPLGVLALILAMVFAVLSIVGLVATLTRTDEQADAISAIIAFGFALLGGNFLRVSDLPDGLRRLSAFTPNGWALRGFTDLVAFDGGPGDIVKPLLAVMAFGAVCFVFAVRRSTRMALV